MTEEPSKSRDRFYRPELDLLRLLAFFMVYVHHTVIAGKVPAIHILTAACGSGIQVFFVLSSYLITEPLLREQEASGTVRIGAFFKRRILRIWPLYFFFIIVYTLVSSLMHAGTLSLSAFLSLLLLAGNWYTVLHDFLPPIIGPLWSISLEEQYYLLWPFIGRFGRKRGLWVASLLSFFGAYVALFLLGARHAKFAAVWTNSFVEFQYFGLGAILALLLHKSRFTPAPWARVALLAVSVLSIGTAQRTYHVVAEELLPFRSLAPSYLLLAIGVSALFLAIQRLPVPKVFSPLLYLGKISYGLYVYHMAAYALVTAMTKNLPFNWILSEAIRFFLGLAVTIAAALLSYRFLESPFLRLKRRFTYVATREV